MQAVFITEVNKPTMDTVFYIDTRKVLAPGVRPVA